MPDFPVFIPSLTKSNCFYDKCLQGKVSDDGYWSLYSNFMFLFLLEGTWTSAATLQFQKLCVSKLLVGIVDEYVDGILHLFLCDTSSEEDVYFHCVLRDQGHADVCGENIPSQVRRDTWVAERKGRRGSAGCLLQEDL